jgi:carboxyl-terminal processing protease
MNFRYLILISIIFCSFTVCSESNNAEYIKQFKDVFEIIEKKYVQAPDKQKMADGAIRGMLKSLDPYSTFFVDDDLEDFMKEFEGEFGGIGVEIFPDKTGLKIISPIDDLPASKAGIKAGDIIVGVDDYDVGNEVYDKSIKKIRGAIGTKVKITIYRAGEKDLIEFNLTREAVKIHQVKIKIDNDLAYIRIGSFSKNTFSSLIEEMQKINAQLKKPIKGIILDLRNNPGGLLDQAIKVSSYFIQQGVIVSVKSRDPSQNNVFVSEQLIQRAPKVNMVVLINEGSASASEIVAGALQDHKRAIVLGTKSFGKGSVQEFMPITKRSAIKLTEAKFYSPNGKEIQGLGVTPDILVEEQKIDYEKKEETVMQKFFNNSKNQGKEESIKTIGGTSEQKTEDKKDLDKNLEIKKEEDTRSEKYLNDYQYARAFDLIKGLNITNQSKSK